MRSSVLLAVLAVILFVGSAFARTLAGQGFLLTLGVFALAFSIVVVRGGPDA